MENLGESAEILVGAKKRKSYKIHLIRATTPADSGFKEPSLSRSGDSHPVTDHSKSAISHCLTTLIKEDPAPRSGLNRISARIQKIKEEKETNISAELQLRRFLEKQRVSQPKNELKLSTEMARYLPCIVVKKMTADQVSVYLDDWKFLNHTRIIDEIRFDCEIIAEQKHPVDQHRFLVRLTHPSGIRREKWMQQNELISCTKKVDVQTLSWSEKLLVRDHLITSC